MCIVPYQYFHSKCSTQKVRKTYVHGRMKTSSCGHSSTISHLNSKYFITFWGFKGLLILLTPPNGVEVSLPDVTPEVGPPVLAVTIVAEKQQLLTSGDDGGNPVGFRVCFHSHLQFHPRSKAILQTCVHLNREMLLTTR